MSRQSYSIEDVDKVLGKLAKNKGNGNGNSSNPPVTAKDMEKLIEKASQTGPTQTIRIEQAPLNLTAAAPASKKEEPPFL